MATEILMPALSPTMEEGTRNQVVYKRVIQFLGRFTRRNRNRQSYYGV